MGTAQQELITGRGSVEIHGKPALAGRLLRAEDLPEIDAQALDRWAALARRLDGQFAVIANSPAASIAVTDLTGSWPVFLDESAAGGGFGSTLQSVTDGKQLALRSEGVARFLAFGNVGGASGLIHGVRTVPGASVCLRDGSGMKTVSWFDWLAAIEPDRSPVESLEKEFRAMIKTWTELRVPENGRVGVLLSGGTDSGLMATMMKELLGDRLVCITQDFFAKRYSERADATETARRLGVPILVAPIGRKDYYEAFVKLNSPSQNLAVWATEGHNQYCLAKFAMEQGIQTLITGYGADYLFLGQGHFFNGFPRGRQEYLDALALLTPEEKLKWVTPRPAESPDYLLELLACLGIPAEEYQHWVDEFIAWRLRQLTPIAAAAALPKLQQISCQIDGGVEWQEEHGCLAVMRALPGCTILCPFYSADTIRFALKLPPDLIFRDGQTKYFLRRLFKAGTGLTRVKSHASLSPLRFWRFLPDAGEYGRVSPAVRSLYLHYLGRNVRKLGARYNPMAKLAALGSWMNSHQVMVPTPRS
jgi:hypothetical protein